MKRRPTPRRFLPLLMSSGLLLAACGGGFPDQQAEPETPADVEESTEPEEGAEPEPETEAAAEPAETTEREPEAEPEPDEQTEPEPEPQTEEAPDAEATVAPEPPPTPVPTPDLASQAGTATVVLSDGRTFTTATECEVNDTSATGWSFRFEGISEDGVEMEGVYDASQPDFTVLFLTGADALQGDDVFLSNINGGDDVVETSTGGTVWTAQIVLTDEAGAPVTADLEAGCG